MIPFSKGWLDTSESRLQYEILASWHDPQYPIIDQSLSDVIKFIVLQKSCDLVWLICNNGILINWAQHHIFLHCPTDDIIILPYDMNYKSSDAPFKTPGIGYQLFVCHHLSHNDLRTTSVLLPMPTYNHQIRPSRLQAYIINKGCRHVAWNRQSML